QELLQLIGRKVRHRLGEFEKDGAAHAGLHAGRTGFLRRSGRGSSCGHAADFEVKTVAPTLLATTAAVQVDDDLVVAKLEAGDLHVVAGVNGGSVACHRAVELLGVDRLADVKPEAFLACRQRLDRLGKFAGHVADQAELRRVLESRASRTRRGGRLAVGSAAVGRKKRDFFPRGKDRDRSWTPAEGSDAGHTGVSQEEREDRKCEPALHGVYGDRERRPTLFYDAARLVSRYPLYGARGGFRVSAEEPDFGRERLTAKAPGSSNGGGVTMRRILP